MAITQGLIIFPEKQDHKENSLWEYYFDACIFAVYKNIIIR